MAVLSLEAFQRLKVILPAVVDRPIDAEGIQHRNLSLTQLFLALPVLVQPVVKPDFAVFTDSRLNVRSTKLLHIGLEGLIPLHPAGGNIPVHTDVFVVLLCPRGELILSAPDLAVVIVDITISNLVARGYVQMSVFVIKLLQRSIIVKFGFLEVLDEIGGLRSNVEELLHLLIGQVHFLPDAFNEVHPAPHGSRITGDVKDEGMLTLCGNRQCSSELLEEDAL